MVYLYPGVDKAVKTVVAADFTLSRVTLPAGRANRIRQMADNGRHFEQCLPCMRP